MGSHAIPILVKNGEKLQLDENAARKIFGNPQLRGRNICIISISGSFRKGKSFMLNIFLRYLRNDGWTNRNWKGNGRSIVSENGFSSVGGIDPVTSGILIHEEVFTATKDGKEIAILLMDTQGLFDFETSNSKDCNVFALSTILSSMQIYNLSQQVHEHDLQYLELFTEYAQTTKGSKEGCKQFQALTFLIRDWPNKYEFDFGMKGGNGYLEEMLKKPKMKPFKTYLKKNFEKSDCCLLPYPGENVAESDPSRFLTWSEIGEKFLDETEKFIHRILKPENLVLKCINGQPIPANAIIQLLEESIEGLNSGKLPNPERMMKSVERNQNLEAENESLRRYVEEFSKMLASDNFYDEATLNDIHVRQEAASLNWYNDSTPFGGEESRSICRQHLQSSIKWHYQQFKRSNSAQRLESESRVSELILDLAEAYESSFKVELKATARSYLDEKHLESLHETISSRMYKKYEGDNVAKKFPMKRDELTRKMERLFQKFNRDNERSKRIDEEKDTERKSFMVEEMELVINFRRTISKEATKYIAEHELRVLCTLERKNTLDIHTMKLAKLKASVGDEKDRFDARLKKEIAMFTEINTEYKKRFAKGLTAHHNDVMSEYEKEIRSGLQNGWMEVKKLRELHDDIVKRLVEAVQSKYGGNDRSLELVQKHFSLIRKDLEGQYKTTKKLNEENYSYWVHGFVIAEKSYDTTARAVVGVANTLNKVVKAFTGIGST